MTDKPSLDDFYKETSKSISRSTGFDIDLTSQETAKEIKRIPTGIFTLDRALMGGFPMSKLSMVAGAYHSCKTSVMCKLAAQAQRKYPDRAVVFFDMEDHLDLNKVKDHGVDLSRFKVLKLISAGQVTDAIRDMLDDFASNISLILVDSLTSMSDIRMMESKKGGDGHHIANISMPISKFLNFLEPSLRAAEGRGEIAPAVVCANHYRVNMDAGLYGPKVKLAGGDIPNQRSYLTLMMDKVKTADHLPQYDETNEEHSFITIRAKIHKCKLDVNPPKSVDFSMCIGANQFLPPAAIDQTPLLKLLIKHGLLSRSRKDITFKELPDIPRLKVLDGMVFDMREDIQRFLIANLDVKEALESVLIQEYRVSKGKPATNSSEDFLMYWLNETIQNTEEEKEHDEVA